MRRAVIFLSTLAAGLVLGAQAGVAADCAPKGADPLAAAHRMYAGLMAGDKAATLAAFDAEGAMFDGGQRFTPEALVDLILKIERDGSKMAWRINEHETHTACDLAWGAWTTRGTFTTAAGAQPRTWLESGVFVWRDGAWKIRFFHSTPVKSAVEGHPGDAK